MKKFFCIILSIMLVIISVPITVFAEQEATLKKIPVEYSDNRSQIEYLDVMVKENRVYVNAEQLADRFGYDVVIGDESILIKCLETPVMPRTFVIFDFNDTKVTKMLYSSFCDKFEAPFASEKNENGVWIPFEYSVLVLNSGIAVLDNCILIDIPEKTILDCFYDAQRNSSLFCFDWAKDFAWDEGNVNVMGVSSQWVNMLNGVLAFDYLSWVQLLQTTNTLGTLTTAYDAKYGERIATLICTQSDEEIKAEANKIDAINDIFSEDGHLGNALISYSKELDESTGSLFNSCNNLLEKIKSGNSSAIEYNKTYREFEKAMDKQTWFSNSGEKIIGVQKGLSKGSTVLKAISYIADYLNCINEFQKQDDFAVSSLKAEIGQNRLDGNLLLHDMKGSMKLYANQLSTDVGTYSAIQFIKNNATKLIEDGAKITAALGSKANLMLFAWNLASNFVPFISEGLEATDNFELALYSQVFQADAGNYYRYLRDGVFNNNGNITSEDLYKVSQYCYVYLKSCYVTRNAALGAILPANKEKMLNKIDAQNSINKEIAEIIANLKSANEDNKDNVYGFLLADNKKYLENYSDNNLVSFIESNSLSTSQNITAMDLIDKSLAEIVGLMGDDYNLERKDFSPAFGTGGGTLMIYNENTMHGLAVCPSYSSGIYKDIENGVNVREKIHEGAYYYDGIAIVGNGKLNDNISADMTYNELAAVIGDFEPGPAAQSLRYVTEINGYSVSFWFAADLKLKNGKVPSADMKSANPKLESIAVHKEKNRSSNIGVSTMSGWKKLYTDYIDTLQSRINPYSKFSLIDLDGNGIPELLFNSGVIATGGSLCSVAKERLITVEIESGFTFNLNNYIYVPRGRQGHYTEKVFEILSNEINCVFDGVYSAKTSNFSMNNPDDFNYKYKTDSAGDYLTMSYSEYKNKLLAFIDVDLSNKIDYQYDKNSIISAINGYA